MNFVLPPNNIAPAQIFVGPHDHLIDYTHSYLQKIFCQNSGCGTCALCFSIRMHQYYLLCWLSSSKPYTCESLEDIFSTIRLALDENTHFFFVIERADLLTASTANRLLKCVEEPPEGYHFIFLTDRPMSVLGTIVSRCVVRSISHVCQNEISHALLYEFFTARVQPDPLLFISTLEKSEITEPESINLVDAIFTYWFNQYKQEAINHGNPTIGTQLKISVLQNSIEHPPMSGSTKLFLKNLFMQLHK